MAGSILLALKLRWSRDREYYKTVKHLFGFLPNNIELYKLALIHRSASLFLEDGTPINNERLEFLGDAVIEAIVSDYLFIEFPERDEGFLTQLRSKIVSRSTINALGLRLGLDRHIIVQGGGNFAQKHLYGDALEAMVGAMYLDKGYEFANRLFINEILRRYINLSSMTRTETDFKSRLIEWGQKNKRRITFSTVNGEAFTSQHPTFRSTVLLDGAEIGTGEGGSKKEAEQRAAMHAAERLRETAPEGAFAHIEIDIETI